MPGDVKPLEGNPAPAPARDSWMYGVALCAAYGGILLSRHVKLWEPDVFMHLAVGREIADGNHIPKVDVFSHTCRESWIAYEWLFELVTYGLQRLGGWHALTSLRDVLITLSFVPVWRTLRLLGIGRWWSIAGVLAIAGVAAFSVELRPQVITFLFLPLSMHIVYLAWRGSDRWLWLLPALMLVWVNMHAGFVAFFLGVAVLGLGVAIAAAMIRSSVRLPARRFGCVLLACFAMTFINPHGVGVWLLPWIAMREGFSSFVGEWQPPHASYAGATFALMAIGVVLAVTRWRSVHPGAILLLLFWSAMGLMAKRNIALFAYVGLPIVFLLASRQRGAAARISMSVVVGLGLFQWGVFDRYMDHRTSRHWGGGVDWAQTPAKAAEFIMRERPAGMLFNDYDLGGYLMFWLYPEYPVFIDGRTDLYGKGFFLRHRDLMLGRDWRSEFDNRRVNLVVVNYAYAMAPASIIAELDTSSDWSLVFWDDRAMVYVRNRTNPALVERCAYRAVKPAQSPVRFMSTPELAREAFAEIERKLHEDPDCRRARWLLDQAGAIAQGYGAGRR